MTWQKIIGKDGKQKRFLLFENDPGRRNHSLVGTRHLRNIISLHMVSQKLLLLRLGKSKKNSYWTFIKLNGQIHEVGHDLEEKLSPPAEMDGQHRYWTKV